MLLANSSTSTEPLEAGSGGAFTFMPRSECLAAPIPYGPAEFLTWTLCATAARRPSSVGIRRRPRLAAPPSLTLLWSYCAIRLGQLLERSTISHVRGDTGAVSGRSAWAGEIRNELDVDGEARARTSRGAYLPRRCCWRRPLAPAGCASSIGDRMPTAIGGLPANAPQRPPTPPAFPARARQAAAALQRRS